MHCLVEPATSTFVDGSLPEVAVVGVQAVGSNLRAQRITQPAVFFLVEGFLAGGRPVGRGLEALGHCGDVDIQVIGEEVAYFYVLMVAHQRPGILG